MSRRRTLVEAVLADLDAVQDVDSRHSSHEAPVMPSNKPLQPRSIATVATIATPQAGSACGSKKCSAPGDPQRTGEEASIKDSSVRVAIVATVASDQEFRGLANSHKRPECGYSGYSGVRAHCSRRDGIAPRESPEEALARRREGIGRLARMAPPSGFMESDWASLVERAQNLVREWGERLLRLGWTPHDLFALHRSRPMNRYDHAGLVRFMDCARIIAASNTSATIRMNTGATQSFCRNSPNSRDWILMWEYAGIEPIDPR